MATYAIGDVQGCYDELRALIRAIQFKSDADTLWFVGDLVNRGPKSLAALRYIRSLSDNAVVVLGNHDLHLLSCRYLAHMKPKKGDTTQDILAAADCEDLLDWLRQQKLAHHDESLGFTMVHAGLPPDWGALQSVRYAEEVTTLLRGDNYVELLENMYGDESLRWSEDLAGWQRIRFIINALTRLRFSRPNGSIDMSYKGPLGSQPYPLRAWFEVSKRSPDERIVFGHWSSLKLSKEEMKRLAVYPVDTGAVWGGKLSALRLDDLTMLSVDSKIALPIS